MPAIQISQEFISLAEPNFSQSPSCELIYQCSGPCEREGMWGGPWRATLTFETSVYRWNTGVSKKRHWKGSCPKSPWQGQDPNQWALASVWNQFLQVNSNLSTTDILMQARNKVKVEHQRLWWNPLSTMMSLYLLGWVNKSFQICFCHSE